MADQVQLRGGTSAQHAAFTGAVREVTVDTDKKVAVVHDGATPGGIPMLRQDLGNLSLTSGQQAAAQSALGVIDPGVQEFRLTLTTGVPVTTSDVTGATSIFCTPYKGNRISLYDGSKWNTRTSAEFSFALGTLTNGKPYDVFCYDNAGTPALEVLAWTNDTTRATALAYQDGRLVKSGATTRRYLGTFYTTAATTTEDSAANRYLWNYYNRVDRAMSRIDTTDNWTYTTATWRQVNGSASNQLNFVVGVAEDSVFATASSYITNSSGGVSFASGVGLNSTSANSAKTFGGSSTSAGTVGVAQANFVGVPVAGRNYLAWLEISTAAGTTTWYGDGGGSLLQTGIVGGVKS